MESGHRITKSADSQISLSSGKVTLMATVHQGASWEENGVHTKRVPGERGTDPEMAGALIVSGAGGEGGVTQ